MRRSVTASLVVLSLVPLAGGCTSVAGRGKPAPEVAAASAGLALAEVAWRASGITPVSPAVGGGGRILVYGAKGAELTLYALDSRDGRVVWSRAASTSAITPGIPWKVVTIGRTAVYLRPAPEWRASLVAVDAAAGRQLWATPPLIFDQEPEGCLAGDRNSVCALQREAFDQPPRVAAYRVRDGRTVPPPQLPTGRWLGDRIADLGVRDPEMLAGYDTHGRQLWSQPVQEAFGARSSSDGGWTFERYDEAGLIVGVVGSRPPSEPRFPLTLPTDLGNSAGLRAATGAPAWRAPHTNVFCNERLILPSSGKPTASKVPVRCRYGGSLVYARAGSPPVVRGGHAIVEGFDLRTGRSTWRWDAGAGAPLLGPGRWPVRTGQTEVVLPDRAGRPFVVDLRTGRSRPASAATVGWCPETGSFRLREPLHGPGGAKITQRSAGTLYRPCTAAGAKAAAPTTVPADLVAHVGAVAVVAQPTGVVAYRVR